MPEDTRPDDDTRAEPRPKGEHRDVFSWNDDVVLDRTDRLALVARALCIVSHLDAAAMENGASSHWATWGVARSIAALVKKGNFHEAADLLCGLESQVPQSVRAEWPLAEVMEAEHNPEGGR